MIDYSSKINKIDNLVLDFFNSRSKKMAGIAVGIAQNNKFLYQKGFGFADIENKKEITMDTVFRAGSTTKILTAIGIMQLWEQGKFKLDDPVNNYLPPEMKIIKKNKKWPEITFKHLLTHTSGMGEFRRFREMFQSGFGIFMEKDDKFIDMPRLSNILDQNIKTFVPAGTEHHYANWGYCILGYLTEIISGERWEDYIRNHILIPLQMNRSDVRPSDRVTPFEAIGYNPEKEGKFTPTDTIVRIIPAGNLMTTVNDMNNLAEMLHNKGKFHDSQIIKPETFELMAQPHFYTHEVFKKEFSRGLGFYVRYLQNKKIIEHGGNSIGFSCEFSLVLDENLTVIIFSNVTETIGYPPNIIYLKYKILQFLLDGNVSNMEQIKNIKPNSLEILKEIKGIYGPRLGKLSKLTNARVYMSGGDFKIDTSNDGHLIFSRVFGVDKEEKILYPTEDPLIYELHLEYGASLTTKIKFVFERNKKGKISYLNIGSSFFKLRKNNYFLSARLWFYPVAIYYQKRIIK